MSGRYAKTKRLVRYGGHLARALLLIVSIAAAAVFVIWQGEDGLVAEADRRAAAWYDGSYSSAYQEAAGLLRSGRTAEGMAALERLMERIGEVDKQDRLAPTWSAAARSLASVHSREGRHREALGLSEALLKLDPNNYAHWIEHARLLEAAGEGPRAVDAFRAAVRVAPYSPRAAAALAEALVRMGDTEGAVAAFRVYMGSNRLANIAVQYGSSDGDAVRSVHFPAIPVSDREERLRIPLEGGAVDRLAIIPKETEFSAARLTRLSITTDAGAFDLLEDARVDSRDLASAGPGVYTPTGPRPAFIIDLPEGWHGAPIALEIGMELKAHVPHEAAPILARAARP